MADPTPDPAVPVLSHPLTPGSQTSEGIGSKVVVAISSIVAVLGTLTTALDKAGMIFPGATKGLGLWITMAGIACASLTQIAYTVQRGMIKVAAIKAGMTPPADPGAPGSLDTAAQNVVSK